MNREAPLHPAPAGAHRLLFPAAPRSAAVTLQERIRAAQESGEEYALVVPFFGCVLGRIEALEDDVATVAMSDGAKVALHFSCVGFLLGK